MAAAHWQGYHYGMPFSSADMDVLSERLTIRLLDYNTAHYTAEYIIRTDRAGQQVPLLFYAMDYSRDAQLLVDGKPVSLQAVPEGYREKAAGPFRSFASIFHLPDDAHTAPFVHIDWAEGEGGTYALSDLHYFEADLSKGEHTIRMEYDGKQSFSSGGGSSSAKHTYSYSLSPAEFWRSFGKLEIVFDGRADKENFMSSMGDPQEGRLDSIAVWRFDQLPTEKVIEISYNTYSESGYKDGSEEYATDAAIDTVDPWLALPILLMIGLAVHFRLLRRSGRTSSRPLLYGSMLFPTLSFLIILLLSMGIPAIRRGYTAGDFRNLAIALLVAMIIHALLLLLLQKIIPQKKKKPGQKKRA